MALKRFISVDNWIALRKVPTNFCAGYNYAGKADLSKDYWNPKRKLGEATHFLGIIKQQHF